jgi:hypothetical protein
VEAVLRWRLAMFKEERAEVEHALAMETEPLKVNDR